MSSNILDQIIQRKREEIQAAQAQTPLAQLRDAAQARKDRRPFLNALATPGPHGANIIAEIKRASPSKGDIQPDLNPAHQASLYEQGGATALSVLTDRDFFKGSVEDFQAARAAVNLPVLRKDFIVDPYQVYETAAMGADAMLLIVRTLDEDILKNLLTLATEIGLDVLVETHSEPEIATATRAGARLIGINNRDLTSFHTDVGVAEAMSRALIPGQIAVAESGIKDRQDIVRLQQAGFHNFLIGETLVRADDPRQMLAELMGIS